MGPSQLRGVDGGQHFRQGNANLAGVDEVGRLVQEVVLADLKRATLRRSSSDWALSRR
jgi:hypothetical protein